MAHFKVHYGTKEHFDQTPLHIGYAYFTPEDGHFYIDGKINGSLQRICLNPVRTVDDIYKHYNTRFEFPNVGESGYIYVDDSNGDVFLFGIVPGVYTSIGLANDDTIYGGDAAYKSNGGI